MCNLQFYTSTNHNFVTQVLFVKAEFDLTANEPAIVYNHIYTTH